ncbi:N-acetyl-gamma-glutamyl-phosphate reductase [Calycomorphotria hydatis]|uniref:N-acetyl-gamma-glutamyl-phosphate reductase n=1 Tax=Calycomorphotria hydatis TaxID=2528027 RepID=A0A517TCZ9_9PLAN|nr:N-acetyl-gamma-glutamyl-phosphate reductase [Calycomorphotria hydatis]QDT66244.1 N-acetyl-gamma-glutamyl-phosphate reductase [Calycomorphotria hydatis]
MRVAIYGATGYTALELLKILLRHPEVEVTALTTRQENAPHISEVHPILTGRLDVQCQDLKPAEISELADLVFTAVPHGAAMHAVPEMLLNGCKVVDLSADYRLNAPDIYEAWYGLVHTDPTRLGETVYGLPELFAEEIPGKQLIANPGCYTSTSILGLAPLLANGLIEPTGIIIDAKSGVSGAGRSPKMTTLFPECNESISAYSVGRHRHTPEIEQVLTRVAGEEVSVIFTPHLVPMDRGILATMYATPTREVTDDELLETVREYYKGKPFVRVVDRLPATKDVAHTNFCDITVRQMKGKILVLSCTDNLIKGASGVAVQNMNLLCGYDETMGLL